MKLAFPPEIDQPTQTRMADWAIDLKKHMTLEQRGKCYPVIDWALSRYAIGDLEPVLVGWDPPAEDDSRAIPWKHLSAHLKAAERAGLLELRKPTPPKESNATPQPKKPKRRTPTQKAEPEAAQPPREEERGVPVFAYLPERHAQYVTMLRDRFAETTGQRITDSTVIAMMIEGVLGVMTAERMKRGRPLDINEVAVLLNQMAGATVSTPPDDEG